MKTYADHIVSTLSVHGIHLLSSTPLHGEAHTYAHERLYLRLTRWGEPRYFSIYWAISRPKLESGTIIVLCTWIRPTLCKLYVELRSPKIKIWFSLNITSILEIAHLLRICQTQSFERVFVVIIYTDSLLSLEGASRFHRTLIWYFIIHPIHPVSLKLSKRKVNTINRKAQKTVNWLQNVEENTLKIICTKIVRNEIIHVQSELKHSPDSFQFQQIEQDIPFNIWACFPLNDFWAILFLQKTHGKEI